MAASLGIEPQASGAVATAIVVIRVTYVSIVFGELVPSASASWKSESIAGSSRDGLATCHGPFVHLSGLADTVLACC